MIGSFVLKQTVMVELKDKRKVDVKDDLTLCIAQFLKTAQFSRFGLLSRSLQRLSYSPV